MSGAGMKGRNGFTLIEILVVLGIFGIVMTAVYTLYGTQFKRAMTQDEVVEVQQNLRIAMERITRDVRMAGVLIPLTQSPIVGGFANYSSSVTFAAASAEGYYARVNAAATTAAAPTLTLTLDAPESTDVFNADPTTGDLVRLIRPMGNLEVIPNTYLRVKAVNRTTPSVDLGLSTGGNFTADTNISVGDMLAKVDTGAPYPNTVAYSVVAGAAGTDCPAGQKCIARSVNGAANQIVAQNITSLKLSYLMDDGTESANPAALLTSIRAVRVTVTGQVDSKKTWSGPKTRQLTSVVKLRNRR